MHVFLTSNLEVYLTGGDKLKSEEEGMKNYKCGEVPRFRDQWKSQLFHPYFPREKTHFPSKSFESPLLSIFADNILFPSISQPPPLLFRIL
ncbi:hypothetical protein NPIL_654161 [Nephila pilipes]|uniref:Uncharacterized protein n=1 Tax=Nephila pilipes TaxID=299642 RepID=A0A8X6NDH0_NEPPI|nr:hypothetical protein NPIL_654161 [Nephila pilipes]